MAQSYPSGITTDLQCWMQPVSRRPGKAWTDSGKRMYAAYVFQTTRLPLFNELTLENFGHFFHGRTFKKIHLGSVDVERKRRVREVNGV